MQADDITVRVPLRARDGTVRAYALIDAADAEFVNQWRWSLDDGYATRKGPLHKFSLHRELLGLTRGDRMEVDHRNRNKLDNRRANLRAVTRSEQMQNLPSQTGSLSPHRGVDWHKNTKRWRARVTVQRKQILIGYFSSESEAAVAVQEARARLMPYATN